MKLIKWDAGLWELQVLGFKIGAMRLRTKLLLAIIPPVVAILAVTGYVTHFFASHFLNQALERHVSAQTLAMAHELEIFFHQCREDLLLLSRQPLSQTDLLKAIQARSQIRGYTYREVALVTPKAKDNVFLLDVGRGALAVRSQDMAQVKPSPLVLLEKMDQMERGSVWVSDIMEVTYPPSGDGTITQPIEAQVLRFATPYLGDGSSPKGILLMGVDLKRVREVLSLFNSPRSPLFSFVRSPEPRYSFLFDREGWILFQAEAPEDQEKPLSVQRAREGLSGTFGRPGLNGAFRPDPSHGDYWNMVREVFAGKSGTQTIQGGSGDAMAAKGYAPVRFTVGVEESPTVLFGLCYVDRSRLPLWAGYRQIDVMFVLTMISIAIIAGIIIAMSEFLTRPILRMAGRVSDMLKAGKLEELNVDAKDYETAVLKSALNALISSLRTKMEELKSKEEQLQEERQRGRAQLEEEIETLRRRFSPSQLEEIVGVGPLMEDLKSQILKAAAVDADVLIIGETGTGKQLIAEAIHKYSRRRNGPFVSINCGALDENLLLDTLFGHVKGAFTEAKDDRKGAFLQAHGGTLFLDEIGTASPKVQQALLRALSVRKIRPLGSDKEVDVDVRLIAASNVELKDLMAKGAFREDLYYRLDVLTIRTPPLRDHKENIPLLVDHFLKQASRLMNKEGLALSMGALEKLKAYHWPGNVRELMNCITRAVAMAEGPLIQAEDLRLGEDEPRRRQEEESLPIFPPLSAKIASRYRLNARQRKAWPEMVKRGRITRAEYEEILEGKVPPRTALYDLQDMVAKGILRKVGKGPATQYEIVDHADSGQSA